MKKQQSITTDYFNNAYKKIDISDKIFDYQYDDYENPQKSGGKYFRVGYEWPHKLFAAKNIKDLPLARYTTGLEFSHDFIIDEEKNYNYIDFYKFERVRYSPEGRVVAYSYQLLSERFQKIKFYDQNKYERKEDVLRFVPISNFDWYGNGIYYTRSDSDYLHKSIGPWEFGTSIMYHKVGTDQSEDLLVFRRKNGNYFYNSYVFNHFLFIMEMNVDRQCSLYFKDLSANGNFQTLLFKIPYCIPLGASDTSVFVQVSEKNNLDRIIEIPFLNPELPRVILPECRIGDNQAIIEKNTLGVVVTRDSIETLHLINLVDLKTRTINFDWGVHTHLLFFDDDMEQIFVVQQSIILPDQVKIINLQTEEIKSFDEFKTNFKPEDYNIKFLRVPSSDSAYVPLWQITGTTRKMMGPRPCIILFNNQSFYHGFKHFSPLLDHFLMQGGVLAIVSARGSSFEGQNWSNYGSGLQKRKSIEDLYHVATHLINQGVTTSSQLGLISFEYSCPTAAATINEHPDLFKAVHFFNGTFDVMNYDRYNFYPGWKFDFCHPADSLSHLYRASYSPLQLVKTNTIYPSFFIYSWDCWTKASAIQSYKYVSALQEKTKSIHPILFEQYFCEQGSFKRYKNYFNHFMTFFFKELGVK